MENGIRGNLLTSHLPHFAHGSRILTSDNALWLMLIEEGYDNSKIAFFMLFWACMDRFWANEE